MVVCTCMWWLQTPPAEEGTHRCTRVKELNVDIRVVLVAGFAGPPLKLK